MQIKNTRHRYGLISSLFHWVSAILVISTFSLGFYLASLSWGIEKFNLVDIHASIGCTIVLFVILRMLWRFNSPAPKPIVTSKIQGFAMYMVHLTLLLLLIALFSSGYIMISSGGNPVKLFDIFFMPELQQSSSTAKQFRNFHEILVWTFIGVLSLHVLAALFHHFIKRDATLKRIMGLT